ncbi:short chain dehydrogenase [Amycolatopsis mediterranei S699]|uniref:Short chain dehydrogenase n=1 Tax=Amycolatopsis mediterranei (strain S699) TaxID=713604 RepID=A0A9R0P0N2_AMYMS|nr:short chain dehydrogenase [Amycolatopsis mediterranei S699]
MVWLAQTQDIFDINVYGVMRMTKAVLPHMRGQRQGRIINVSSLSGFVPSPFMTLYVSVKHAVEGYSQSLDHEVREHGVRILLVEPGLINTPFAGHSVEADTPMPLYAAGRRNYDKLLAKNLSSGDDPAVVAKVIVAAATDRNPKLRRTAGTTARTLPTLRLLAGLAGGPARVVHRPGRRFAGVPRSVDHRGRYGRVRRRGGVLHAGWLEHRSGAGHVPHRQPQQRQAAGDRRQLHGRRRRGGPADRDRGLDRRHRPR